MDPTQDQSRSNPAGPVKSSILHCLTALTAATSNTAESYWQQRLDGITDNNGELVINWLIETGLLKTGKSDVLHTDYLALTTHGLFIARYCQEVLDTKMIEGLEVSGLVWIEPADLANDINSFKFPKNIQGHDVTVELKRFSKADLMDSSYKPSPKGQRLLETFLTGLQQIKATSFDGIDLSAEALSTTLRTLAKESSG